MGETAIQPQPAQTADLSISGLRLVAPPCNRKLLADIRSIINFQLSFATTATTIVSGGIAERCNFYAYCLFSLVNTVVYCLPAGWLWADHGFLK